MSKAIGKNVETVDLPLAIAWEDLRWRYFSKRPHYQSQAQEALLLCRHYQQRLVKETA
jgi:hypothetical protein